MFFGKGCFFNIYLTEQGILNSNVYPTKHKTERYFNIFPFFFDYFKF